jgi:hypothetical protein
MAAPVKEITVFLMLVLALFIASCSSVGQKQPHPLFNLHAYEMPVPERDETDRVIGALKNQNALLTTYKGIGNIRLWTDKNVISSRAAWIGDSPVRLRLEMLGVHGGPIASIAINGAHFYYYSHADKQYYARPLTDDALKPLFSFSLPVEVVTQLLMGRIPVFAYRSAKISENPSGEGYVLTIVAENAEKAQKIYLNSEKKNISMIEYFDKNGVLDIRAVLSNQRSVGSFEIPFTIAISDGKGNGLKMDIDRCWTDIPVEPSVFVLTRNPR